MLFPIVVLFIALLSQSYGYWMVLRMMMKNEDDECVGLQSRVP